MKYFDIQVKNEWCRKTVAIIFPVWVTFKPVYSVSVDEMVSGTNVKVVRLSFSISTGYWN